MGPQLQTMDEEAVRLVREDPNEEDVPIAMARRVRVWRELRGMRAVELAEAAHISRSYLFAIEGGQKQGSVDVLKSLAEALGVGLEDLA